MATGGEEKQYGVDEHRFELEVSPNFCCCICLNVLKEPKICGVNEHVFCHDCIMPHLANSQTCPQCMQHLTPETLKPPPRLFLNCLSELKVHCKYNSRGCPVVVELGHLESHEGSCEYTPVKCQNNGCELQICKKDQNEHENFFCKFRNVACQNCEELKLQQNELLKKCDEMTQSQKNVEAKVDKIRESLEEIKTTQKEMQGNVETLGAVMSQQWENVKDMMEAMFPHVPSPGAYSKIQHFGKVTPRDNYCRRFCVV